MWAASKSAAETARNRRRGYPIHAYVGHNGDGKTLTMVFDTLPTLEAGRPVLSTVRLLDYLNPRPCEGYETIVDDWYQQPDRQWRPHYVQRDCEDPWHGTDGHMQAHELYSRFTRWEQLLAWKWGDVDMDEVTGVADASEWASVPSAVVNKFPQLRRDECALRISTLSYSNANKRIRQACLAVTKCVGTLPASPRSEFGAGRHYRPRRMVVQHTYDAKTLPMDDPSMTAWEKAKKVGKGRLWVPEAVARLAYDTFAPVDSVGTVTDSGRCAYCAGTRRAPECSCVDYVALQASRKAARRPPAAEHDDAVPGRHAVDHDHAEALAS